MNDLIIQYTQLKDIPIIDFIGKSREKDITLLRHIFFYVIRQAKGWKLKYIGSLFNRDHSTIVYGCNKIKGLLSVNDQEIICLVQECRDFLHLD